MITGGAPMDRRRLLLIVTVLITVSATVVLGVLWYENSQHARIDEWSIAIRPEGFDWAEVSTGYGVEKKSYVLTEEDIQTLTNLLQFVTEQNCTRKMPKDAERTGSRLVLKYDGKLWQFHCLTNGMIRIVFEDPETAEYYGCDDSRLYMDDEYLYQYILDTVRIKAE